MKTQKFLLYFLVALSFFFCINAEISPYVHGSFHFREALAGEANGAPDVILSGTVVTPDKVITKGWIAIKGGRIDFITENPPASGSVAVIETGGIIFPGFIDLHNHPMYNVFTRWHPDKKFSNRYEWRDLKQYQDRIGTPGRDLQQKHDQTFCDLDAYAEVKALIGGSTSITGISPRRAPLPLVPSCVDGLIRNLDWASGFYGPGIGNERIENIIGVTPRDLKDVDAQRIPEELTNKKIDLLLIHLAEGSPRDMESTVEFLALKGRGFLGDHTAIIHGTALGVGDFRQMRATGTALIWSPRSNMELYGCTTNIAAAFRQGVTIALAPDWSPTGSNNMLAELRYASRFSREQLLGLLSDRALFEMATAVPARIARIDDKVGSLQPGLFADLVVLKGDVSQPFAAIVQAQAVDIQLVLVGGVALYGTEELMNQFKVSLEPVDVYGVKRLLNFPALSCRKFADAEQRLKEALSKYNLNLAPLEECIH
jgi:hypothetical protein